MLPASKLFLTFTKFPHIDRRLVVVLSVIVYARRVMRSVNVEELEGLKYDYKGA